MIQTNTYTGTELFQILLTGSEAAEVMEEWIQKNIQADIRFRRAKTKGCVVMETRDVLFASHIVNWHPGCQVNIKK